VTPSPEHAREHIRRRRDLGQHFPHPKPRLVVFGMNRLDDLRHAAAVEVPRIIVHRLRGRRAHFEFHVDRE